MNDSVAFVEEAGADGSLDVVSFHYYPYYGCHNSSTTQSCTPGLPLAADALTTPAFLDGMSERTGRYSALQRRAVPHGQSWLTATATAGLGGVPNVSDAFVSTLWMLDALGAAAKAGYSWLWLDFDRLPRIYGLHITLHAPDCGIHPAPTAHRDADDWPLGWPLVRT